MSVIRGTHSVSKLPRILVFAPAFAPSLNPESLVNSKLALAMLAHGWDVEVVSWAGGQGATGREESEWPEPWRSLRRRVHAVPHPTHRGLSLIRDCLRTLLRTGHLLSGARSSPEELAIGLSLHAQKPFDLVLSRGLPDAAHLPAMLLARRTGIPWIANWNDPPNDSYPPPYPAMKKGFVARSTDAFVRTVADRASVVTFPCERLARYVEGRYGVRPVPPSAILPHIALDRDVAFAPSRANGTVFRLCHAGGLHTPRDPLPLLRAMAAMARQMDPEDSLRLRLVGGTDAGLAEEARRLGVAECLEFVGKTGYLESIRLLGESDVLVIVEAPCEEGIFLPSKFVDYVQTGRPILALSPRRGTLNDMLGRFGGGLAVDCRDEDAILHSLQALYRAWKARTLEAEHGSSHLFEKFAPETIVSKYAAIIGQLTKRRREDGARTAALGKSERHCTS